MLLLIILIIIAIVLGVDVALKLFFVGFFGVCLFIEFGSSEITFWGVVCFVCFCTFLKLLAKKIIFVSDYVWGVKK